MDVPSMLGTGTPSGGAPFRMGEIWVPKDDRTKAQMAAAILRGPHKSPMTPEAWEHFRQVITEKVVTGQAQLMEWDAI